MTPLSPFVDDRILSRGFRPMDITGSSGSQRRPWHAERCLGRKEADAKAPRRRGQRPTLRDAIATVEIEAGSDEAYFLAQLRAAVAIFETPGDRLLKKYLGRSGA